MERFDRQIRLFGRDGQARLERARIAIVGLGGLGSHVAQQLAYLGIRQFILIDGQIVEESNLNRLIGASPSDLGDNKVDVAERMIHKVEPSTNVVAIARSFVSVDVSGRLEGADYIVGCLDNDGARLVLTTVAATFGRPYIDIATDVLPEQDGSVTYGGRVTFAREGDGCLFCLGELDQEEIQLWMATAAEREARRRLYGDNDAGPSPSVVTLNGVLASAACTELMVAITGLRIPKRSLIYDGNAGKLRVGMDNPPAWCPYCTELYGGTDRDTLGRLLARLASGGS